MGKTDWMQWLATLQESLPPKQARLIAELGNTTDIDWIVPLTPYVFSAEPSVREGASAVVHRLLAQVPAADLPALDQRIRTHAFGYRSHALDHATLREPPQARSAAIRLQSCHHSGYVRADAVRALRDVPAAEALPFLLLRTSDWVEAVAREARAIVEGLIAPQWVQVWARQYPLLLRLGHLRRGWPEFVARVDELLLRHASDGLLIAGLQDPHAPTRRAFWRLFVQGRATVEGWLGVALGHADVTIRQEGLRQAASLAAGQALQVAHAFLVDPAAAVRCNALRMVAEHSGPAALPRLEEALFDRNAAVRASARFYLGRAGAMDFASRYRDAVRSGRAPLATAVAGLCETGSAADAPLVARFLAAGATALRARAVRGVAALAADSFWPQVQSALADPAPSVSREARRAMEFETLRLDPAHLGATCAATPHAHVRRNAFSLLCRLKSWDATVHLLRVARSKDLPMAGKATEALWRRLRSSIPAGLLAAEQASSIEREISESAASLPGRLVEMLRFTLRSARLQPGGGETR